MCWKYKLDNCFNTLNDLSNRVCIPNKTRFKYICF